MTTPTPDWPKLRAIPWSAQTAQICGALGHAEIPPEGRPRQFHSDLQDLAVSALDQGFTLRLGTSAGFYPSADAVADATRCRGSGPTNEALRQWLRWWGWNPPAKAKPSFPATT